MKTLITFAIVGFFLPMAIAHPQWAEFNCLDWKSEDGSSISASEMRSKLLSGVWTKSSAPTRGNQNYHLVVRFHPNGKASYLTQTANGTYNNDLITWSTLQQNNQHFLTLGEGAQQQQFLIEPFCEGIELINVATGRIFSLSYGAPADKGALLHRLGQLCGTWVNVSHDIDVKNANGVSTRLQTAKIQFDLRSNGTYSRQLWTGNSSELIAQDNGMWELSNDGKLIHFYPEGASYSYLAQVKWFELDELVLEQVLNFPEDITISGIRDLYFNKQ